MGQKRRFGRSPFTSGPPRRTDISGDCRHVSNVPSAEVHERKPHHPAFAPCPTVVPLQATIRLSCVHGGLDSIDPDQGLADTLERHIRLGAGHGYDGAADSRDRGR